MTIPVSCAVCASVNTEHWAVAEDWEYRTSDEKFDYFRCHECNVLFLHPAPVDRLRQIYPENYYSFAAPEKSIIAKIKAWLDVRLFRSILSQLPGESLRVLDVGGGTGWQLNLVRQADRRVSKTQIVDIDPVAGQIAREQGHDYFCGTIEQFEAPVGTSPDQKFELVLLLNIIEHVERPDRVLTRIRELLAPGGVALIKTPNYDALDARIFRHASWAGYHCPRHWVLFTHESFASLAKSSGLRVERFSFTQGAPFWSASLLGALARRNMIEITRDKPVVYHRLFPVLNALFAAFDFLRRPVAKTSQMFFQLKAGG
jgi:2-polyprenyl-3-methyl-5-hydroxy-6-metoxy-1,4-benzoquinol methylase